LGDQPNVTLWAKLELCKRNTAPPTIMLMRALLDR
jgi:hypothetical protein